MAKIELQVFQSLSIYLLILLIVGAVAFAPGCSTAEGVIKKTVDAYCSVAPGDKQQIMRAYYDAITAPHQLRIICNSQPTKTKGDKPVDYLDIRTFTVNKKLGSPYMHCVDECVKLAAETGSIVMFETQWETFIFAKNTTAHGVSLIKKRIIDYQEEDKKQLSLMPKLSSLVPAALSLAD